MGTTLIDGRGPRLRGGRRAARRGGRLSDRLLLRRNQPLVSGQDDETQNYGEKKAAFHQLWDRIQPRAAKWVATEHALEAQPSAPQRTVGDD